MNNEQDNLPINIVKKGALTWQILNQKHDCYDAIKTEKLSLLLRGGFEIIESAQLFMPKWKTENPQAYQDRLSFATYENNFGEIINDFGSTLFSKPLSVLETTDADDEQTPGEEPDPASPHMQWQEHFTLDNQKLVDFMCDMQTESNAIATAYFGVDFQDREINGQLTSLPYAYHIDPLSVLDWQKDDEGNFTFIIMKDDDCRRDNVRQLRNTITTTFTVWSRNPDNGKVEYDQYQIKYLKDQPPAPDTPVPHLTREAVDISFKKIPIIECNTPDSLSIGKLIGQLAASMYMRYSTFLFCLNRGLNPLLVYKQGAELPANGDLSIMGDDEDRGYKTLRTANTSGKAVIGPTDELEWAEIKGSVFDIAQTQLEKDKNELYRLVASLNSIIGKSGVSTAQTKSSGLAKVLDNQAKEHMLAAYSKLVKSWIIKAFELVFEALGQNVIWQCKGMDNYKVVDEDTLLAKITALPDYKTNMPSKTSYKQVCMDLAYDMHPFTNVGTMNKIQEEIAENIEAMDLDAIHQSANTDGTIAADGAKQLDKAVPQTKPAPSSPSDDKQIGPGGQALQPEGAHLQTGKHVDSQLVFDQLKDDYKEKDIQFVLHIAWIGPVEVPLSSIDFSNKDNWQAAQPQDQEHVDMFAEKMKKEGFSKPIILVNNPSNDNKMMVVDGHHRVLAAQQNGQPVSAYIGQIGSDKGPWSKLHDKQTGRSNQIEQSAQKETLKSEKMTK